MKKTLLGMACALASTAAFAQSNYIDWANDGRPDFPLNGEVAAPNNLATVTSFTDVAAFLNATNTVTETFNNGLAAPAAVAACTEPVNSASNDTCFNPGDLLDGFTVTSDNANGIVVLGDAFLGPNQDSAVMGAQTFADITQIAFDPAITAVGIDTLIGAPAPGGGDITLTAFDSGGGALGNITVTTAVADDIAFIGLTSDTPIANITVDGIGGSGELIDNLYFGNNAPPPPPVATAVPTMGSLGMWLMIAFMLAGCTWFARRRGEA
ncbi:MAG: hypothetical protein MI750_08505 [Xanthomonadales bacterium]|nr:hypothetical protein [Xanthomonadales bacterium]